MTLSGQLDRWREQEVLSEEQCAFLSGLSRGKPFSVFLELNALLYLGVIAFIGGLGWTVRTYSEQLGDVVVLAVLTGLLAACLWYCFSRAEPRLVSDYVLYLGSLTWSIELAYLETRFHILAGQWDLYLLATACFFFLLAYRFDNRFVLSLALSTLAAWFGVKISRWPQSNDASFREYAILYSLVAGGAGVALARQGIRKHFLGTYLHVAANVLFGALLSGVFNPEDSGSCFLILLVVCGASLAYGLAFRQFAFVAYAAIYGYIGVSSMLVRGMNDSGALLSYFLVTGIAMIGLIVWIARRFGRES